MPAAQRLRKLFEYVASLLSLQLDVMITDGSQPIGNGIGPVLEARDVMRVLRNDPAAPADLREKSLRLAGRVIEFDPDVRGGDGWRIARDILESGRALAQMEAIIDAQGRRGELPALGELTHEMKALNAGKVCAIDNLRLARIARLAGAPQVMGAGVDLLHKVGDPVIAGGRSGPRRPGGLPRGPSRAGRRHPPRAPKIPRDLQKGARPALEQGPASECRRCCPTRSGAAAG
jgi:thymidine phosphorylase